jgi:hypothetical protein
LWRSKLYKPLLIDIIPLRSNGTYGTFVPGVL